MQNVDLEKLQVVLELHGCNAHNLLSCMKRDVEIIHSVVHQRIRKKVFVTEHAMFLLSMHTKQLLAPVTCDDDATMYKEYEPRNLAQQYFNALPVRQETTMAKAGTLSPYSCISTTKKCNQGIRSPFEPAEPSASEANERDEAEDEDDKEDVLEYDSSSSDGDSNRKIGRQMIYSGAPNDNFRKISARRTIRDLEFVGTFFVKFLLAYLSQNFRTSKNGIIAHF